MKSKTSCFNRTIFLKNVTTYWPMWVLYLLFLICTQPLYIWSSATSDYVKTLTAEEISNRIYRIVDAAVEAQILPIPIFLFAGAAALLVFSYLYVPRNANMIHALPVNRMELFVTNYLSGFSFLVVPQLITFVLTLLVCLAYGITHIQYLMAGLIIMVGETFFAYSLAVFVAMLTGQMIAMPILFFVVNYLYVGCLYLFGMIITTLCYGVSDFWNPGASCILSPIYYLGNNLRTNLIFGSGAKANAAEAIEIKGGYLVGIYAMAAVALVVLAYQIYKRRQVETAGDWLSIRVLRPIFRWGFAVCGGILLSLFFEQAFIVSVVGTNGTLANAYPWVVGCMLVFGGICFFVAQMLLDKRFRVFNRKRMAEWGCFSAVSVLLLTLFAVDVFGIESRVPQKEEIKTAFVYMDYPVELQEADIEELREIHGAIIANKKPDLEKMQNGEDYYYTTIRYYLKDGGKLERRYALPVTEEVLEDEESPSARILEWESRADNLRKHIFGQDYETNEYEAASVDRYNDEQDYNSYSLDREETAVLLEAVERDIEAGNLADYYAHCAGGDSESYMNELSFEYRTDSEYYSNYDYYNGYRINSGDVRTERADRIPGNHVYTSIRFGVKCTNIVETLEELGIIDDTWKLMTNEEYEALGQ